jgi:hypothetical protein
MKMPAISIVVVGADGDQAVASTQASLAAQGYFPLQVVVEDAAGGCGEALSRGFAKTTGDVLAMLRAGDTLLPGALRHVSRALDGGARVVMGRTALWDERGVALQHPGEYIARFDHLAVWKRGFNSVPQCSLFWHRSAHPAGVFSGDHPFESEYDLVCRIAARHDICNVDAIWAARAVASELVCQVGEREMLATLIAVSRRHWGPWWSPRRWRCQSSFMSYLRETHERARHHARLAEVARADGGVLDAQAEILKVWWYSPAMARGRFGMR